MCHAFHLKYYPYKNVSIYLQEAALTDHFFLVIKNKSWSYKPKFRLFIFKNCFFSKRKSIYVQVFFNINKFVHLWIIYKEVLDYWWDTSIMYCTSITSKSVDFKRITVLCKVVFFILEYCNKWSWYQLSTFRFSISKQAKT